MKEWKATIKIYKILKNSKWKDVGEYKTVDHYLTKYGVAYLRKYKDCKSLEAVFLILHYWS